MTPDEAVDLAIERAGRYPVFPIALSWDNAKHKINKRPLTIHGHKDATRDPEAIRELFDPPPLSMHADEELGVGLWPGGGDGFVLDLDRTDAADGISALRALEYEHGALPAHPVVTTPSGGEHRYFSTPRAISNSHTLGRGIDVRGYDGWVVAPGTHCSWGSWDIDEGASAPRPSCPPWLLRRLTEARNGHSPGGWKPLHRDELDARDRAALEALEALGGHSAYTSNGHVAVTRPGKRSGASATVGHIGPGVAKIFTPNWPPLEEGGRYDADQLAELGQQAPQGRRLVLIPASTIRPERVRWCWDERLAQGTIALLAGREGLGKSTVGYWIAARLSKGELAGEFFGTPRATLVCATEDSWKHTIVPRLMAAEADLSRVYRTEIQVDEVLTGLNLPADITELEQRSVEVGAALLLLDPLMSRLDGRLDSHKDADVRRALEPVAAMAEKTDMAVLGIIHFNKSGSSDPLQLVMASKAFTAVARSVSTVIKDPDDETQGRRFFGTPKNNLGRDNLPTLPFVIQPWIYDTDDGPGSTGQLQWGEEINESIGDLLARTSQDPDQRSAVEEAAAWLEDYMVSEGPQVASADVKRAARAAGHSDNSTNAARRILKLSVVSRGFPRRTIWVLKHDELATPDEKEDIIEVLAGSCRFEGGSLVCANGDSCPNPRHQR